MSQFFRSIKRIISANPMMLFLWSIIGKWYIMIIISSLIVLFWVAKGLKEIGFIDYISKSIVEVFDTTKSVAQNCIPKLGPDWEYLVRFWYCLGDPPKYQIREEITGEKKLETNLNMLLDQSKNINPYDSKN